jgi:hypothetical protein
MKRADAHLKNTLNNLFLSLTLFIILILSSTTSFADDFPFNSPANWGETGLMETPTARVIDYGKYRVGFSQIDPYRYYYGTVSPLQGLEINGRVTEIIDVQYSPLDPRWKDYGNYKDKAFDFKYQFVREGKYWPAIALGIMDPHGTRLYSGQYLVASKQIFPFDLTIGLGNGRLGKEPLPQKEFGVEIFSDFSQWCSDAQVFGGIEFAPSKYFSFIAEYNPIQYENQTNDPAQKKYFTDPVPSKINYGVRLKPVDWAELDVSYQRGNQIGVNLSFAFNLEKPLIPIYDMLYAEKEEYKNDPLSVRISRGLYESGFRDIGIMIQDHEIWVEAANDHYYYNTRAIGVILQVLDQLLPDGIGRIYVILVERGIPIISFSTDREDLNNFESGIFKVNEYLSLTEIKTNIYEMPEMRRSYRQYFTYGIKPEFQLFLNDPSGFLKMRVGASGWLALHPWKGASLVAGAEGYPVNNISTVNEPLSIPVRSDYVEYLEKNMALSSLMLEQIGKTKHEIFGKLAAGLLETEYAGLDAEIAVPLFKGRILAGLSGSLVKKRDTANPLKLNNSDWSDHYETEFLNAQLNLPEVEMAVDIKAGKFLAGDKGARITVSKFFFNGIILSAWYSMTDTSGFSDPYNNGYHDKGIALSIPLRMFLGRDSRTVYDYSLSPWTRDVAQDIRHRTSLFDFIGRNTGIYMHKDNALLQSDSGYISSTRRNRQEEQSRVSSDNETPISITTIMEIGKLNNPASAEAVRLQLFNEPDAE